MSPSLRPRVLLADDHRLVAEGLGSMLSPEFEVVGVVEDGGALVEAARKFQPDLIVADISMPRLNGLEALTQLKKDQPHVKVVFLTRHPEAALARRAMESGASGFVLKHSTPTELIAALHAALSGRIYVSPTLLSEMMQVAPSGRSGASEISPKLTPRQREILQLLAEGRSAKEIADTLSISTRTVECHKYQMMETLGLHQSAELIHFAIKQGIVAI